MHNGRESRGRCRRRRTASGSTTPSPPGFPPLASSPWCARGSPIRSIWSSLAGRHAVSAARGDLASFTVGPRPALPSDPGSRRRSCTGRPASVVSVPWRCWASGALVPQCFAPHQCRTPHRSSGTCFPRRHSPRRARISVPSLGQGASAAQTIPVVRQSWKASSRQNQRPLQRHASPGPRPAATHASARPSTPDAPGKCGYPACGPGGGPPRPPDSCADSRSPARGRVAADHARPRARACIMPRTSTRPAPSLTRNPRSDGATRKVQRPRLASHLPPLRRRNCARKPRALSSGVAEAALLGNAIEGCGGGEAEEKGELTITGTSVYL